MQEEISRKTVNLAISTTKLTARAVIGACKLYLNHCKKKKAAKAAQKPVGRQSIGSLMGQNQGVEKIDLASTDLKGFEKYARKYHIDYAVTMDTTVKPPKYTVFFKAKDNAALETAMRDYSYSVLNRGTLRKSILNKLNAYKERAAAKNRTGGNRVRERGRNRNRNR